MPAAVDAARQTAYAAHRPVVLTLHAMAEPWEPVRWRGAVTPEDWSHGGGHLGRADLQADAYDLADSVVAVGHAVAASHRAHGADRMIEVIPNASRFAAPLAPRAEPVVGYVGRLAPIKRLERLIAAMALVRQELREARLVLIGPEDGPNGYLERLRGLANDAGLDDVVRFIGPDRPERWYPEFAVLALSSDTEGMPLAVLEAGAHGVPCVGPDVGGMREAIGDGGIVVMPDDAEALAAGILTVLGDQRLAG